MYDDDEQEIENEHSRHALAQLLQARGHQEAAALVAVSSYWESWVDNLNGGTYDAGLAVPAELYDMACGEFHEIINAACLDIVGRDRYRSLKLQVRRPPYDPEWVQKIVEACDRRWVRSERIETPVLDGP